MSLKDNDDTHVFTIPAGTTIAAGGFSSLEDRPGRRSAWAAPTRPACSLPDGTTLVDSYTWTAHAATTYGRCPNGTGAFATTTASDQGRGERAAPATSRLAVARRRRGRDRRRRQRVRHEHERPRLRAVRQRAPGVLWAVKNGPARSTAWSANGTKWTPDTADGWSAGKALRYPDGTGDPDAEGVTFVGSRSGGRRLRLHRAQQQREQRRQPPERAALRPASAAATSLTATDEWNLTADLPAVAANLGLEAISWMPDAFLTSHGFLDEHTGAAYDPASYPNHGDGLFFVGVEANGTDLRLRAQPDDGQRSPGSPRSPAGSPA